MNRVDKLYQRLDALEADFRGRLVVRLEAAAAGKDDLTFCSTEFGPDWVRRQAYARATDELLANFKEIRQLREKLGESIANCLAQRYREYCDEYSAHTDKNAGGTVKFAERLLAEIAANPDWREK